MQLHELTTSVQKRNKKRIGRGGKRGKTSGRGHKGQGQHGSHGMRPELRDIIKRLPKLRGYRFNSIHAKPIAINFSVIEMHYNNGDVVNAQSLYEKKQISKTEMMNATFKVLGKGELTKKVTIEGMTISAKAKELLEKVGGKMA